MDDLCDHFENVQDVQDSPELRHMQNAQYPKVRTESPVQDLRDLLNTKHQYRMERANFSQDEEFLQSKVECIYSRTVHADCDLSQSSEKGEREMPVDRREKHSHHRHPSDHNKTQFHVHVDTKLKGKQHHLFQQDRDQHDNVGRPCNIDRSKFAHSMEDTKNHRNKRDVYPRRGKDYREGTKRNETFGSSSRKSMSRKVDESESNSDNVRLRSLTQDRLIGARRDQSCDDNRKRRHSESADRDDRNKRQRIHEDSNIGSKQIQKLFDLVHEETPEELMTSILKVKWEFIRFLNNRVHRFDPCKIVHLVCTALKSENEKNRKELLKVLAETGFIEKDELVRVLQDLALLVSGQQQQTQVNFLSELLSITLDVVTFADTSARFQKGVFNLLTTVVNSLQDPNQNDVLAMTNEVEKHLQTNMSGSSDNGLDTVRDFGILPSFEAILDYKPRHIKHHVIDKPFNNDADYLHHMFVLFREDFMGSFSRGIYNYLEHCRLNRRGVFFDRNVRNYENVNIAGSRCLQNSGLVWDIQIDISNHGKQRWDVNNLLQFGNLVGFIDRHKSKMYYATIADRHIPNLRRGITSVSFLDNFRPDTNNGLVMLESKSFFIAYAPTLKAIKNLSNDLLISGRKLPFHNQIVKLNRTIQPPLYVKSEIKELKIVSFRCLQKEPDTYKFASHVSLLEHRTWPTAEDLGLDKSQFAALELALTKEVAIIQGPPGTGKTVLGLKIVNFFLNNQHLFVSDDSQSTDYGSHSGSDSDIFEDRDHEKKHEAPIVLVSYTNHALDQFLCGTLNFPIMKYHSRGDIVRIGSRCNNKELEQYNMNEHLYQIQIKQSFQFRNMFRRMKDVERLDVEIKAMQTGIIHENYLYDEGVLSRHEYDELVYGMPADVDNPGTCLLHWLEIGQIPSTSLDEKDKSSSNDDIDEEMTREENWTRKVSDELDETPISEERSSHYVCDNRMALSLDAKQHHPFWKKFTAEEKMQICAQVKAKVALCERFSPNLKRTNELWRMPLNDRWKLYREWMRQVTRPIEIRKSSSEKQFVDAHTAYKKQLEECKLHILQRAKIVAFTTTGAAKNIDLLRKLSAKVLIIEEAAHVPEQHVLGCITLNVQHLILIGDHQQLRPAANDIDLARNHNTEVSLLERLVNAGVEFRRLSTQHRMSPEISQVVCPVFYKNLHDDRSVHSSVKIRGVLKNVVFLNHNITEDAAKNGSHSRSNMHEAEFLIRLYTYLRQQGYEAQQITVLTLYNDQVRLLRRRVRQTETEFEKARQQMYNTSNDASSKKNRVNITAVDNYQGEENDIILLSLVRSNEDNIAGHVKTSNRICVALTRAKKGMYVIGNLTMMRRSKHWDKILSRAEERGMLTSSLELVCQTHPETTTMVTSATDFDKVIDGGCSIQCSYQLNCGHICDRRCHIGDEIHNLPCTKKCKRELCSRGHQCEKECSQPCGSCHVKLSKLLNCGHEQEVECYKKMRSTDCTEQCDKLIECGHRCQMRCSKPCNTVEDCKELVKVALPCSHECQVACFSKKYPSCRVPCSKQLPCGHQCKGKCGECCQGRLHIPCKEKCKRQLVCGHPCTGKCCNVCPPCKKKCSRGCVHLGQKGCDRRTCGEVCILCREECEWKCCKDCKNAYECTKMCHEMCARSRCNEPCLKLLKCKHACLGICGEMCPDVCKVCSKDTKKYEEITTIFFGNEDEEDARFIQLNCKHIFEVSGLDQWIENENTSPDGKAIVIKRCPRCNTPIRSSTRYANILRRVWTDVKCVQDMQHQFEKERATSFGTYQKLDMIMNSFKAVAIPAELEWVANRCKEVMSKSFQQQCSVSYKQSLFSLWDKLHGVFERVVNTGMTADLYRKSIPPFLSIVEWLFRNRSDFGEFEGNQCVEEIRRFALYVDILTVLHEIITSENCLLDDTEKVSARSYCSELELTDPQKTVDVKTIREYLAGIEKKLPATRLKLSTEEKNMVMKAMNFTNKGHWYKCKNGHIYCIGECGGAMETSRCPDCKTEIGGQRHKLLDGNSVASEMDGARHAAWSDQANMLNYDLD